MHNLFSSHIVDILTFSETKVFSIPSKVTRFGAPRVMKKFRGAPDFMPRGAPRGAPNRGMRNVSDESEIFWRIHL